MLNLLDIDLLSNLSNGKGMEDALDTTVHVDSGSQPP